MLVTLRDKRVNEAVELVLTLGKLLKWTYRLNDLFFVNFGFKKCSRFSQQFFILMQFWVFCSLVFKYD